MAHSRSLINARSNILCTNVSINRSPTMNSTKQRSLPIQCQSRRGYHQYETASSSTGCSTKAEYDLKTWLMYNRIVQARLKSSKRGGSSGISYSSDHANGGSEILDTIQDSQAEPELIYDGEIFQLDL